MDSVIAGCDVSSRPVAMATRQDFGRLVSTSQSPDLGTGIFQTSIKNLRCTKQQCVNGGSGTSKKIEPDKQIRDFSKCVHSLAIRIYLGATTSKKN